MKLLKNIVAITILILLAYSQSYACTSDTSCGFGKKCIKAEGDWHYDGVCVTIVNEFGQRDYQADFNLNSDLGPKKVHSCSWDTDCNIGFKCMKRSGSFNGFCVK